MAAAQAAQAQAQEQITQLQAQLAEQQAAGSATAGGSGHTDDLTEKVQALQSQLAAAQARAAEAEAACDAAQAQAAEAEARVQELSQALVETEEQLRQAQQQTTTVVPAGTMQHAHGAEPGTSGQPSLLDDDFVEQAAASSPQHTQGGAADASSAAAGLDLLNLLDDGVPETTGAAGADAGPASQSSGLGKHQQASSEGDKDLALGLSTAAFDAEAGVNNSQPVSAKTLLHLTHNQPFAAAGAGKDLAQDVMGLLDQGPAQSSVPLDDGETAQLQQLVVQLMQQLHDLEESMDQVRSQGRGCE
jgi:hypothetical protein